MGLTVILMLCLTVFVLAIDATEFARKGSAVRALPARGLSEYAERVSIYSLTVLGLVS